MFIPKPEGFEIVADRWEYLYQAKDRGIPVEAVVEKVTWPKNLLLPFGKQNPSTSATP